jgi:hypothetical protein
VWVYSRYGIRLFHFKAASSKHYEEEREKLYDGYVCYSPKDEEFVLQSIVAELEHGNPSFQLCLHYRDLVHHSYVQHSASPVVLEAADASRRVILVLSRNFLQTEWSRFEFRSALHEALKGRIFKLVLVEESSSLPEAELDPDLRPYLKTGARVRWGEKRFWERLRYAMPNGDGQRKSSMYRRNINNYTLDSGVSNGAHHHAYLEKTKTPHSASPNLQMHINNHPLFQAAAAAANNEAAHVMSPPAYSSTTTLPRTPLKHQNNHQEARHDDDANYSSATTATPSPRPAHRHNYQVKHHPQNNFMMGATAGLDSSESASSPRPISEHIYSSIDSDYSTLEREASGLRRGVIGVHHHHRHPWRTAGAGSVMGNSGAQAYLV